MALEAHMGSGDSGSSSKDVSNTKSTRRTYSAEELHRLRGRVSQPRLSEAIEEHDAEDAELVKEHVLRGSKSFAARSWKSRQPISSLRVPSNKENRSTTASDTDRPLAVPQAFKPATVLGEIVANNQTIRPIYPSCKSRPSPTPSIRKKKIESLVKAHGSPPHVRVTAGGRIVPSEQSPLCHPRYGYSAIQVNGGLIKFAPNHPVGKAQWTEATQNGFVAQDIHGRLCQIVGKEFRPLEEINGALRLFIPAPNLRIADPESSSGPANADIAVSTSSEEHRQTSRVVAHDPPPSAQINALQLEYSKLNLELKDVDKTEVLHGRTMSKVAKDALISKRRELVTALDKIRRAIKSLEQQKATATATSPAPKCAAQKNAASPQKNRLPPFLQQRHVLQQTQVTQAPSGVYAPFFGPTQPQAFPPPFGFQTTPSPTLSSLNPVYTPSTNADSAFNQQWGIQSAPIFVPPPPPPFDGSMSSASLPYLPGNLQATGTYGQSAQQFVTNPDMTQCNDVTLPQHDGSHCCADLQRVASPRQSHALPIKAPEQKALKSNLNPMSPIYKPSKNATAESTKDTNHKVAQPTQKRTQAPSSPSQPLDSPVQDFTNGDSGKSPRSSPLRKETLVQSSSISSFATADFFPSNTREYSTRKDEYPEGLAPSAGKENATPLHKDLHHSNAVTPSKQDQFLHGHPVIVNGSTDPTSPQTGGYKAPAPPPGTPVQPSVTPSSDQLPLRIDGTSWERQSHGFDVDNVPDRHAHNLSPKVKRRDWLFVEEDPAQDAGQPSSSPEKFYHRRDEICVQSSQCCDTDFLKKPRDFIEGYKAGVDRRPPSFDRSSDWLEGYCTALMKLKPQSSGSAIALPSNGSPSRPSSRRPSPVPIQQHSSRAPDVERRNALLSRPSLATVETALHSLDSLKQAVFAPQNENAVLTPAVDGPHVSEAPLNLGAWARHQDKVVSTQAQPVPPADSFASFQFPSRTASIVKRHTANAEECVGPKDERMGFYRGDHGSNGSGVPLLQAERSGNELAQSSRMSSFSSKSAGCGSDSSAEVRLSSMSSIDSNLYRNWPGHRIFSPHLEYKSISSVAQHAGLASGYFAQGQYDGTNDEPHPAAAPKLTNASSVIGAPQSQRPEFSAGECTAPQTRHSKEASLDGMSSPPKSPPPPQSPPGSPRGSPEKGRPRESPNKGSPARVKFEHIAEKVGIKVNNTKDYKETTESNTPPGKRRWHNVWKGFGNGKDVGRDEGPTAGCKQSSRT